MNERLMGEWSEEVWLQRKNPSVPEQSLLMLDSAKCHLTDYIKSTIHAKMAVIPGGLTKKLQALDISVNKSFKSKLRAKWEEWMINTAKHTYTSSGKMRHASLQEVCNWIVESWKDVTPECILNGFRRA